MCMELQEGKLEFGKIMYTPKLPICAWYELNEEIRMHVLFWEDTSYKLEIMYITRTPITHI